VRTASGLLENQCKKQALMGCDSLHPK